MSTRCLAFETFSEEGEGEPQPATLTSTASVEMRKRRWAEGTSVPSCRRTGPDLWCERGLSSRVWLAPVEPWQPVVGKLLQVSQARRPGDEAGGPSPIQRSCCGASQSGAD